MNTTITTRPAPTVPDDRLADLADRLGRARSTSSLAPVRGLAPERLAALVARWRDGFDWRAVEAEQAAYGAATTTTADGRRLHHLHLGDGDALPLLLLHGWPDSPLQFRHLIPALVAAGHPVVAPTAAGFGFSDEPAGELSADLVAADITALMAELGYDRYLVHATDWGATVAAALAAAQPDRVAGLHLLQPPFDRHFLVDRATTDEAETGYLEKMDAWAESAAYVSAHLHAADTLAAAFDDSPVGLLAWVAEKYDASSGDRIADDDVIAATATMWLTGSFRSSVRLYSEPASGWGEASADETAWDGAKWEGADSEATAGWAPARVETPTAFAIFPQDIGTPPRQFCERFFAVERFTVMPRGGHWAALEEPDLVAQDLLGFAATLA